MAAKTLIIHPEEIKNNLIPTPAALDAYNYAVAHAGLEMDDGALADFVTTRNAKSGWRDLWELKAWCEKTGASIKEVLKHTFNCGTEEELPAFVKWSKQSYSYEFAEGAGAIVAGALIKKRLVTNEQLLNLLTPSNIAKATGINVEKLIDMFPDVVAEKPKERTLNIK